MKRLLPFGLLFPLTLMVSAPVASPVPQGGPISLSASQRAIRSLPFLIDQPGSYFVTDTLTGTPGEAGITIDASDVTLNLAGFSLTGDPNSMAGILVQAGRSRITIKNGKVVGWTNGIDALSGTDIRVSCVDAAGNSQNGIAVGDRGLVENCTAVGDALIGILASDQATVRSCTVQGSGQDGIQVTLGGLILECQARDCGGTGIQGGPTSIIRDCRAEDNGDEGIRSVEAGKVSDSVSVRNGTVGIRANGRSIVEGCISIVNTLRGIECQDASMAVANVANGNGQAGVFINAFGIARDNISHTNQNGVVSRLGIVRDNLAVGALENGVVSHDGDVVEGNLCVRSGLRGVLVNLNDTRIAGNHLIENPVGIRALQPSVTIYQNSLSDNVTNFQLGANTDQGCEILAEDDDAYGNIVLN